jgi:hypothetical protein
VYDDATYLDGDLLGSVVATGLEEDAAKPRASRVSTGIPRSNPRVRDGAWKALQGEAHEKRSSNTRARHALLPDC